MATLNVAVDRPIGGRGDLKKNGTVVQYYSSITKVGFVFFLS